MKRGKKTESASGPVVSVWDTFTLEHLDLNQVENFLNKFDFGQNVLMAVVPGDDGGKAWRREVKFGCEPKVLTVEVIYDAVSQKEGTTPPCIFGLCKMNAENAILKAIEEMMTANDVKGNKRKPVKAAAVSPPAPPATPAQPATPPAAQPTASPPLAAAPRQHHRRQHSPKGGGGGGGGVQPSTP